MHFVLTVVLGKQLNFKSVVIRSMIFLVVYRTCVHKSEHLFYIVYPLIGNHMPLRGGG